MTQDELDALPDVSQGFSREMRVIDGRRVMVPVAQAGGALYQSPDDGMVIDAAGRTGWSDGSPAAESSARLERPKRNTPQGLTVMSSTG